MDSVNQPELPPAGHHSVLTSDTSLLTRTSYTTTPDIDDLFSESRSIDTTSSKSPTHHRFSIKPPKITTVDSLLSFLHYICLLPEDTLDQLYDFESTIGLLTSDRLVSFCGSGLSFVVQEHPDYKLPDALLKSKGGSQYKSKPSAVAIKIPRIERGESSRPDPSVEGRALRTMAWECHVLSHPPIRQCENIVGIYGLTWRAVFSGHDGTRRLLPSLVMELANEGTLNDLFDPDTYCLSYSLKRKLAMDIATGLEILHNHGIIHGDVKGDNVLLFSDKQGSLTAKVADFGCAVHDFGPLAVKPMPGRSPPWDAPEVRHGPIALPKLHKTDIYSLGLLVWRLMLEGQSPFDNTENSHKFPGFEGIYDAKSRASQLLEIQKLKDSEDDELLRLMKTTLSSRGLDESQLGALFDLTVRHHEKDRTETLKDFLLGFGGGALESLSWRSVGRTNDSISDLRSNSVIHNLIGDGRPTEIAIPAQEFKTNNEFILDWMMRDEFQMSRTFMGSTWEDPYVSLFEYLMSRLPSETLDY
jgi:serine/threonine protein kinase